MKWQLEYMGEYAVGFRLWSLISVSIYGSLRKLVSVEFGWSSRITKPKPIKSVLTL